MTIYPISLPPLTPAEKSADRIIEQLTEHGFTAFRVGGAVRDRLLGRPVSEVDVATDATPAMIRKIFPDTYAVGEAFAVIIVHTPEHVDIEVATFRSENGYADGRHPKHVAFSDAATDARRRDFTINALFYHPIQEEIVDHTDGLADLRTGTLRAIGNPEKRFGEDHLRIARAVRFAAELDFKLEQTTTEAIKKKADFIERISKERIFNELNKMLTGRNPSHAFELLHNLGILSSILPEAAAMAGVPHPPCYHPEGDVWQHSLLILRKMRMAEPALAWSALLHDVGKPPQHCFEKGRDSFPKHAPAGAEMARLILKRLKASRRLIEDTVAVIENHMTFMHVREMRVATRRRLLARSTFPIELELHRLDCMASHGKLDGYCLLLDEMADLANQPPVPQPLINGHDILALGLTPGPRVGQILNWIQEKQMNGEIISREEALAAVRQMLADREEKDNGKQKK